MMCAKSETLLIGYDMSDGKDLSCLQVSKVINGKILVTNVFYGNEAEEEYKKLTGGY